MSLWCQLVWPQNTPEHQEFNDKILADYVLFNLTWWDAGMGHFRQSSWRWSWVSRLISFSTRLKSVLHIVGYVTVASNKLACPGFHEHGKGCNRISGCRHDITPSSTINLTSTPSTYSQVAQNRTVDLALRMDGQFMPALAVEYCVTYLRFVDSQEEFWQQRDYSSEIEKLWILSSSRAWGPSVRTDVPSISWILLRSLQWRTKYPLLKSKRPHKGGVEGHTLRERLDYIASGTACYEYG